MAKKNLHTKRGLSNDHSAGMGNFTLNHLGHLTRRGSKDTAVFSDHFYLGTSPLSAQPIPRDLFGPGDFPSPLDLVNLYDDPMLSRSSPVTFNDGHFSDRSGSFSEYVDPRQGPGMPGGMVTGRPPVLDPSSFESHPFPEIMDNTPPGPPHMIPRSHSFSERGSFERGFNSALFNSDSLLPRFSSLAINTNNNAYNNNGGGSGSLSSSLSSSMGASNVNGSGLASSFTGGMNGLTTPTSLGPVNPMASSLPNIMSNGFGSFNPSNSPPPTNGTVTPPTGSASLSTASNGSSGSSNSSNSGSSSNSVASSPFGGSTPNGSPFNNLRNNQDQNPPCNTLYVGNLPPDTSEEELRQLFNRCPGYKRLCFRPRPNGPMCFVEFGDVQCATQALLSLYGNPLSNSTKGGIRLSYSKNPLGVRQPPPVNQQQPMQPHPFGMEETRLIHGH
ncbi:hypothetical protein HK104_010266 [Borealophlyctis nickersoniae]|nr:hypothetical protein HK104_010266 [Borealophlyctis nickersoniae]